MLNAIRTFSRAIGTPLRAIGAGLLRLLFPPFCIGCNAPGEIFCGNCRNRLPFPYHQTCPACNQKTRDGRFCSPRCKKFLPALHGIIRVFPYESSPEIQELIAALKYRGVTAAAPLLAEFLASSLAPVRFSNGFPYCTPILVPIPLHHARRHSRGYNQSELLAQNLSQLLGWQTEHLLIRTRKTETQTALSRRARFKNVEGCFALAEGKKSLPPIIILIDDVATTGATLNAAARVLQAHGAKTVLGAVIARQTL